MSHTELQPVCTRTLATSHALPSSSQPIHPTNPLILVQNATSTSSTVPSASTSSGPKLSLVRLSGAMDVVWDWTPPPPPAPAASAATGPAKPLNRLQMMKGKGKAATGEIKATVWDPNGQSAQCVRRTRGARD